MAKLPKPDGSPKDYADFSIKSWGDQDTFYNFWAERWRRSIDFIRSLHWRALREMDLKEIPEWKRYPVINITLSVYSDYVSQFLKSRVRFSAVPASPDPSDISGAESADYALRYLWDRLELDAKKTDLAAWIAATGNGDIRVFWDTDTGDLIPLAIPVPTQNGQISLVPINPDTLKPDPTMPEPVMVDAGEIGLEVVPPQLVRWSTKRSLGAMIGYLLTRDEAASRYGDQIADTLSYSKMTGALTADMLSIFPSEGMPTLEDVTLAIEHQLPRSTRFPNGLWWTASMNRKLLTPPAPLPINRIGVSHFRWVPLPGHPKLGLSPLYDITFSNKIYDEMTARIVEWLNKVLPKFIRKVGDGLPAGALTDEPGQELITQPGVEPDFLSPPPPPQHFFEMKGEAAKDALFVGGYEFRQEEQLPKGEATNRFRQPPRTLNEGEVVSLAIINSKPSWQELGYILLEYAAKFYTEPRMISVVGPDRTYQWREFTGSDLKNLPATIHVDELPLYTWNRQSLRDTVMAVLGSKAAEVLFVKEDGSVDRDRINAAMEAVGIDISSDTLDPDIMEARNENHLFRSLREGEEPPQVQPWQNHQSHIPQHTRELKSLSYKGWPTYAQEAFLEHISNHEKPLADRQQQAQEQMLAQEKALREIRAQAETAQDVRTALGTAVVEALMTLLAPETPKKEKK